MKKLSYRLEVLKGEKGEVFVRDNHRDIISIWEKELKEDSEKFFLLTCPDAKNFKKSSWEFTKLSHFKNYCEVRKEYLNGN